jgi:hypothetical protein
MADFTARIPGSCFTKKLMTRTTIKFSLAGDWKRPALQSPRFGSPWTGSRVPAVARSSPIREVIYHQVAERAERESSRPGLSSRSEPCASNRSPDPDRNRIIVRGRKPWRLSSRRNADRLHISRMGCPNRGLFRGLALIATKKMKHKQWLIAIGRGTGTAVGRRDYDSVRLSKQRLPLTGRLRQFNVQPTVMRCRACPTDTTAAQPTDALAGVSLCACSPEGTTCCE